MSDAHERTSRSSRASRRLKHIPFFSRNSSPPVSIFSPSDILPQDGYSPYPKRPLDELDSEGHEGDQPVFGAPAGAPMSGNGSVSPPSVFDRPDERGDRDTEPTTQASDEPGAYDLKPPPPAVSHENIEALADRFFSVDHLDTILRNPSSGPRFISFLNEHRPHHATSLTHYIESKKAITAIQYANAIADQIPSSPGESPHGAATLNEAFESKSRRIVEDLVEEALPAYLTHRLVTLTTDTMVKEITGNGAPYMKELIPNLAEVYCISDPSLPDSPIVYASEEFYNVTQYGRDYAIGRNCRFLQGPKSSHSTVRRLVDALTAGEEICETIVNYRRDGTPFMNLLMLAPMYDNKGEARYFLGCQIDVSPLIEGGKGLESFSQLLAQDRSESRFGIRPDKDPMNLIGELGQLLNEPEADFVMNRMRSSNPASGRSTPQPPSRPSGRRFFSMDDTREAGSGNSTRSLWPDESLGRSGRLPGVYRNYLLVRPYPSLRVTFTSPTLRIPGLLQDKLMNRIGGPQHLKDGILNAFQNSTGVTAKVPWLTTASNGGERQYVEKGDGKPRWIHCTPLFGSDDRVGVWMVVLVENEEVTGLLNQQGNAQVGRAPSVSSAIKLGAVDKQSTGNELYADYLKGGRPNTNGSQQTSATERERREVDEQFRDF